MRRKTPKVEDFIVRGFCSSCPGSFKHTHLTYLIVNSVCNVHDLLTTKVCLSCLFRLIKNRNDEELKRLKE